MRSSLLAAAALMAGPFADLLVNFAPNVVEGFLVETTRMCEDETDRCLAPFTNLIEPHRAAGIDPEECGNAGGIPIDPQGEVGACYVAALRPRWSGTTWTIARPATRRCGPTPTSAC